MLWAVTAAQTTQSLSGRTLVHSIWKTDDRFSDLVLGANVSTLTATGGEFVFKGTNEDFQSDLEGVSLLNMPDHNPHFKMRLSSTL